MKVLVIGAKGRMGQEVINQINTSEDYIVLAGIDKEDEICNNIKIYDDPYKLEEVPDIIIDFSLPIVTMKILKYAVDKKVPMVIATTGFTEAETEQINKCSEVVPIFKSHNMSYNISLMMNIISKLAIELEDNDIEITETHHKNKVDSPSGTALMLANSMNEALNDKMEYMFDRTKQRKQRDINEIGIHSVRGGTEVGTHSVTFFGDNEKFEITHTVTSRSIFAKGAIKAAKFLINKPAKMYNMKDLSINK